MRVRDGLADSLDEILKASAPHLDETADFEGLARRVRSLSCPLPPPILCAYESVVAAVRRDDPPSLAESLSRLSLSLEPAPIPFVTDWGCLNEETAGRYRDILNGDHTTCVTLEAPDAAQTREVAGFVEQALSLLDCVAPEMGGEIRALVAQVILVVGTVNGSRSFDGASAFQCWGALFLNPAEHRSVIEVVEGLAHESGHVLLFGLSLGEPMVENPPEERHPSPLRTDPRPLDGIYHATYVAARMHYAMDRLLAAPSAIPTSDRQDVCERLATSRAAFRDGSRVLDAHARLTPMAARIMASARDYMAAPPSSPG